MKPQITFVYSYYENPGMFQLQQQNWASYPERCQEALEVIVTDDCSHRAPAVDYVIQNGAQYLLSVYAIKKKVPWNWLEARNIGAHHAASKWLLLTDMDHLVSPGVMVQLMKRLRTLDRKRVYQFNRVRMPTLAPYKFHNDSFFLCKSIFWKAGGYDEDLAGMYGTSGAFRNRLFEAVGGRHEVFDDLALILYGRDTIPDASTTDLPRKDGREPGQVMRIVREKYRKGRPIKLFRQRYERVL